MYYGILHVKPVIFWCSSQTVRIVASVVMSGALSGRLALSWWCRLNARSLRCPSARWLTWTPGAAIGCPPAGFGIVPPGRRITLQRLLTSLLLKSLALQQGPGLQPQRIQYGSFPSAWQRCSWWQTNGTAYTKEKRKECERSIFGRIECKPRIGDVCCNRRCVGLHRSIILRDILVQRILNENGAGREAKGAPLPPIGSAGLSIQCIKGQVRH